MPDVAFVWRDGTIGVVAIGGGGRLHELRMRCEYKRRVPYSLGAASALVDHVRAHQSYDRCGNEIRWWFVE